jgi:hypothetical protein
LNMTGLRLIGGWWEALSGGQSSEAPHSISWLALLVDSGKLPGLSGTYFGGTYFALVAWYKSHSKGTGPSVGAARVAASRAKAAG